MSSRGTCTGCGESKQVTTDGLVYRHRLPDRKLCPGSSRLPHEAGVAPSSVAAALDLLIQDLPVHNLRGHGAVVRLTDLYTAIDQARVSAGLPPLVGSNPEVCGRVDAPAAVEAP